MKMMIPIFQLFLLLSSAQSEATIEAEAASQSIGCGPPQMVPYWPNQTTTAGQPFKLSCPMSSINTCLVDMVEWYKSDSQPNYQRRRGLLRDYAVPFDPLLLYFPDISVSDSGWYICVLGNSEGRNERHTYVNVVQEREESKEEKENEQYYSRVQEEFRPFGSQQTTQPPRTLQYLQKLPSSTLMSNPQARPDVSSAATGDIKLRFPVYAQFDDRHYYQSRTTERQPVTTPSPGIVGRNELDAIHQHLNYIYDKMESLDRSLREMDDRIRSMEY